MKILIAILLLYNIYQNRKNFKAMAKSQAEIAQQLNEATAKLQKVGTETRSLITKVDELTEVINNLPQVSPELEAAANAVTEQVAIVDELVPDAPTEPTPGESDEVTL